MHRTTLAAAALLGLEVEPRHAQALERVLDLHLVEDPKDRDGHGQAHVHLSPVVPRSVG